MGWQVLQSFGYESETTAYRGWRNLGNGQLAESASKAGFRAILTRDRLFAESTGTALRAYPDLAIVIVRIAQSREAAYLEAFREQWNKQPIQPVAGCVIEWP